MLLHFRTQYYKWLQRTGGQESGAINTSVLDFNFDGVEVVDEVFNSSFNWDIFPVSSFKVFIISALSSGFMALFFSSLDINIYVLIKE